jgi:hypothetical protein
MKNKILKINTENRKLVEKYGKNLIDIEYRMNFRDINDLEKHLNNLLNHYNIKDIAYLIQRKMKKVA